MKLQQWEIEPYRAAARDACERLHEPPDELVEACDGSGMYVPRWLEMAARLREMHVMQTVLEDRGPYGPA